MLARGPGGKYLIQHSAGSGKTNSIAWTAHFLADLHDAKNKKLFDTVLVVSDRNVIDTQLQEAIFDFERTTGVVATITGEDGSKSGELAEALSGDKKIVVCTIQTFPFALKAVRELAATQGKTLRGDRRRGAQLADRRSGGQAEGVLTAEELQSWPTAARSARKTSWRRRWRRAPTTSGITYVAFTATPKTKTMELFGTPPRSRREPAGPDNLPAPFHVYSMRQAIEEKFILDVLQNYTPYKLAFKLAHNGKDYDEKEVERSAAMKGIMGWVRLHPYNIAQKVADRRRALPRVRGPAARAARPRRWWWSAAASRPCAGSSPSTSTSRSAATRSARWWRSPAR